MECKQVENLLMALCDRTLDAEDVRSVENHLASCSGCARERETTARTLDALHRFALIEPREDFSARLWQKIDEWDTARRALWLTAVAAFVRKNRRAVAVCCTVFVISLLSGVAVLRDMTGRPGLEIATDERPAEGFVIREIPQSVAAADDTVFMHFVTGDRPVRQDPRAEDYIFKPMVRPVSDAGPPF
ncbi:MAG: zf-HC2 domain-containing protein [Candidatus Eisenbacteria bacterium]